jgi:hypothetical protein
MGRTTAVVGFSVSQELAREYQQLAEAEGTSKSELFRWMIEVYKAERQEEESFRLQRKMTRRARSGGVLSEKEIKRIVFEDW